MIKLIKFIMVILLIIIITEIFNDKVFAAEKVYTQSNEIAKQCYRGYNKGTKGPISITEAELIQGANAKRVYLVSLSGTEFVKEQSTGILTDLLSGFELNSPYLLKLIEAINNNVPKGADIIITGHSLGGMIAQQASGNAEIKNNYNVLNVVTFGSPLINPFGREGEIKRLGDTADKVPYLSAMGTILLPWQVLGLNTEDGGYGRDFTKAHVESYLRSEIWGIYDVLGIKNGQAKLKFDEDKSVFFYAPTNW